jgi:hypothetical protein
MKKTSTRKVEEVRAEYQRSDFGRMARGKFHAKVIQGSNVVVLDAEVAKAFPNSAAVNEALGQLLALAKSTVRATPRSRRVRAKAARA